MLPKFLQPGDKIVLIAPAKAIEAEYIDYAIQLIEANGFEVILGKHCRGRHNYFSGTVTERAEDLQWAINHPEAKAILCARGGYGCIHIVDKVDWSTFDKNPKWLLGFSDVTVFHQFLSQRGTASMHATMPLNFKENSEQAIHSLLGSLKGEFPSYTWETTQNNQEGICSGEIVGGNLTVLTGLIGTPYQPDYSNKILFMEDVGEYLYAIDRSLYQLKNAGVFNKINGLIAGNFSQVKDTEVPFGSTLYEIILSHFKGMNIPIAFDYPGGHLDDNRAVPMGVKAQLKVGAKTASLFF